MSSLFLRTLRDDPPTPRSPATRLLVRAGYVRRVAPGVYSWLPLGLRVLRRVEQIVREEMDAIGGQEILLPALLPKEAYEATGRWTDYGPNMFRLTDRKGVQMGLGPTHEEFFAQLVKSEYSSYKDLPVTLYQIQTKYRDEERPRRHPPRPEFVMKDSYSFDLDDAGAKASYAAHREAYQSDLRASRGALRDRRRDVGCDGRPARPREFLAESEVGEDTFVRCPSRVTPPTSRPSSPGAPRPADRRTARGRRARHREHPDHRHPRRVGERCPRPHGDRRRHPQERDGQGHRPGQQPRDRGDRCARGPPRST